MKNFNPLMTAIVLMAAVAGIAPTAAYAEGGFYIGGSVGAATLDADIDDLAIPGLPSSIDEDDTAYKVFAGYNFDLPVLDLGIEASYVDFGEPGIDITGDELLIGTTSVNLWGIAGLDLGPLNVFGKFGYVDYDAEAIFLDDSASETGSGTGYGVGLRFGLGPIEVRGEYEIFDLEDDVDIEMLSVGIAFYF